MTLNSIIIRLIIGTAVALVLMMFLTLTMVNVCIPVRSDFGIPFHFRQNLNFTLDIASLDKKC